MALASGDPARPRLLGSPDAAGGGECGALIAAVGALAALVGGGTAVLAGYRELGPTGRFAAAVVAFAGFAALFAPRVRPYVLTRRRVLVVTAFLVAVAVVTPPRGSHDLWSYAMYGRILSAHHANPFTRAPADYAGDPFLHLVAVGWRHTASVYGPVFVAFAGVATAVAGSSALAARLLFQGTEAAALAAVLWIVWKRTRSPAALAFVGLNPAVLVVINGGHNDLLVGLALLGGLVLLADDRPRLAGVVLAMGALVKLVLLLPVAALVYWVWRRRGPRAALDVGAPVGAALVGAYALFGGIPALGPILHARAQHSRSTVWQLAMRWFIHPSARVSPGIASTVGDLALVSIAVIAVVVVVRATRGSAVPGVRPETGLAVVAGTAALVYLLTAAYVLPWYSAWSLPVLALVWRSRVGVIGAAQAAVAALAYMAPVAVVGPFGSAFRAYARTVAPLVVLLALVVLVSSARRDRLAEPFGTVRRTDRFTVA